MSPKINQKVCRNSLNRVPGIPALPRLDGGVQSLVQLLPRRRAPQHLAKLLAGVSHELGQALDLVEKAVDVLRCDAG